MNSYYPVQVDDVENDQMNIWSTERYNQFIEALDNGINIKGGSPFHDRNPNLRKGNLAFKYTDFEKSEIKKCAKDITYFANNYATVMTDEGLRTIKLRDYQSEMIEGFVDNRFNITLAARQIGKTITSAIFIAWYLLFNIDKNALILSNKFETTKEIIDKAKVILEHLPFFLKPGILKYDVSNMKFDNGCRLVGQSTTAKAGISFTIHLLFLDEFAHVQENIVKSFFENVYPTLSSSQVSRIIITSTPNGFNKFYELYDGAVRGENDFHPYKVDWWQVPGRDEAWQQREIANLGGGIKGEEAFNRQYGNQFIASSSLLLEARDLKRMDKHKKQYVYHEFDEFENINMDVKNSLVWHPDFDISSMKNPKNYWLFSIDIAEGNGGDNSVINIFQIVPMTVNEIETVLSPGAMYDFFKLKQIGRFMSNEHGLEDFSKVIYTLQYDLFYSENIKVILEYNSYGAIIMKYLETIFPQRNEYDEESIVKFKHRISAKVLNYGLKLKPDNKSIIAQHFKKLISINRIELSDELSVYEAAKFGKLANGRYGGQSGHDDLIMSSINASEFTNTLDYADFIEELLDVIDLFLHEKMESILYKDGESDGDLHYDIYDLLN